MPGLSKSIKKHAVEGTACFSDNYFRFTTMKIEITKPLAFFDLETTGTSPAEDRIIQISITKFLPGEQNAITKTRYINPQRPIPPGTTEVNGISDEMVKDAYTFKQVAKSLFEFIKDSDVAGYNIVNFDNQLLREEFLACGINWPLPDTKFVDVYSLVCKAVPRNQRAVYEMLGLKGIKENEWHDAEADVRASIQILEALQSGEEFCVNPSVFVPTNLDDIHEICKPDERWVDFARRIEIVNGEYTFSFGVHKGKLLLKNRSYCQWMMSQNFTEDTKQHILDIWKRHGEELNAGAND